MTFADLPLLNAILNTSCAILLLIGHQFARKGKQDVHKKYMVAAFVTSALFLVSYLTYHAVHGTEYFRGEGWIRPVYFSILGTHTVLAAAIVPLAIMTLIRGLKNNVAKHRTIARWTYPIWLYVSVTGVVIYIMLYQMYPVARIV